MSKKSKASDTGEKPKKSGFKMIKKLGRLGLVGLVIALGVAVYNPELLPHPTLVAMAKEAQNTLMTHGSAPEAAGWVTAQAKSLFTAFAQKAHLPKNVSSLPEEIVVDEVVATIGKELKDLPAHQVKKIKTNICADVINEAMASNPAEE